VYSLKAKFYFLCYFSLLVLEKSNLKKIKLLIFSDSLFSFGLKGANQVLDIVEHVVTKYLGVAEILRVRA